LKLNEAAAQIGAPYSTVRHWADKLGLGQEKDSRGRRVLTADEMAQLETAREMLEAGHGFATIQRRTGNQPAPQRDEPVTSPALDFDALATSLQQAVVQAVAGQVELSEKYARAAHEIGRLEERCQTQAQQLEALRAENERLKARRWWRWGR
jgi:DNA-binding transcriptional MerR regulator